MRDYDEEVKERVSATLKIEFLSKQFKELSDFVKEHMRNEDDERKKLNRKLMMIAAIVIADAIIPGGGATLLKALL